MCQCTPTVISQEKPQSDSTNPFSTSVWYTDHHRNKNHLGLFWFYYNKSYAIKINEKMNSNGQEDTSNAEQNDNLEVGPHNASAESDPLDSVQKAASEADTLPIEKKIEGLETQSSKRYACYVMK